MNKTFKKKEKMYDLRNHLPFVGAKKKAFFEIVSCLLTNWINRTVCSQLSFKSFLLLLKLGKIPFDCHQLCMITSAFNLQYAKWMTYHKKLIFHCKKKWLMKLAKKNLISYSSKIWFLSLSSIFGSFINILRISDWSDGLSF